MVDYIMIAVLGIGVFTTVVGVGIIKKDRKQTSRQDLTLFKLSQPTMIRPEVVKPVQTKEPEKVENGFVDMASEAVAFFKKEDS